MLVLSTSFSGHACCIFLLIFFATFPKGHHCQIPEKTLGIFAQRKHVRNAYLRVLRSSGSQELSPIECTAVCAAEEDCVAFDFGADAGLCERFFGRKPIIKEILEANSVIGNSVENMAVYVFESRASVLASACPVDYLTNAVQGKPWSQYKVFKGGETLLPKEAAKKCELDGAMLIEVSSQEEIDFMMSQADEILTGLMRSQLGNRSDSWYYHRSNTKFEETPFLKWGSGEPNGKTRGEDFVLYTKSGQGLVDIDNVQSRDFICECINIYVD